MMTLREKYEAKLRRTEKYWLMDAGEFFLRDAPVRESGRGDLIFCLYRDDATWTAFFEGGVGYAYEGNEGFVDYCLLESMLEHDFLSRKKEVGEALESDDHRIWLVNAFAYTNAFNFVLFMKHALELERRS